MKDLLNDVASSPALYEQGRLIVQHVMEPAGSWDKNELEASLDVTLPEELSSAWECSSDLYLFQELIREEDGTATTRDYGLHLWGPTYVREIHRSFVELREQDYIRGDLNIGDYFGSTELVVCRCDPRLSDYGAITVALEIGPRKSWPIVASSLSNFLRECLTNELFYWR